MRVGNFKEICEGKLFRFTFPHREDHIYVVREAWTETDRDSWYGICRFKKETDKGLANLPVEFRARLVIPDAYPKVHMRAELYKDGKIIASNNISKENIQSINNWFGCVNDMVTHATQILEPLPF